ncbi:EAL domain-containing protein [Segnochrobactraceae bacterium EtOH-i3]
MKRGASALMRRATIVGAIAAIPVVVVFILATMHHVGEERHSLLDTMRTGIEVDRSRIEQEVRAVRQLAESTSRWIISGLDEAGPVPEARLLGRSFVRPVAGGPGSVEVIEPLPGGAGPGAVDGALIADPTLATGGVAGRRLRTVATSAMELMSGLRTVQPAPAMGFSYFVAARRDLMVVAPPLSTVRFLEAAGHASVASLLDALRHRPYFRAMMTQPGPVRHPAWAGPYRDLFTGEATVAFAAPVTVDGELEGVVGVNLLLERLEPLLEKSGRYPHGVRLVTETGQTLLARGPGGEREVAGLGRDPAPPSGLSAADIASLAPDNVEPVVLGPWRVIARPIEGTPWRVVWLVSSTALTSALVKGMMAFGLLVVGFLMSVGLGIILMRRFIVQPTVRFILFLDEILSGTSPPLPNLGAPWQRWAAGVAAGFARNRELTREATERGDHLAALIRISIDGVITFDGQGHILAFNPAAETMFGVREAEVVGKALEQVIIAPEDVADHRAFLAGLRRAGASSIPREVVERRLCRADTGRVFPAEIAVTGVEVGHDLLLTAYVRDISTRVEHERRIADLAFRDVRTGLPNRIGLVERIDAGLVAGHAMTLGFIEFAHFGDIRLSFGHEFAEQVTCVFVRRLVAGLPEGAVVARVGPSQLAVYGEGPGTELIRRIEQEIARPLIVGGRTIALDCAIGATRVEPGRISDAEAVLREAETAALMARRGSHPVGVVLFDPGMLAHLRRNAEIEQGLRRALERTDELWLAFQPILSLTSGQLIRFEVLVRWKHPDFGAVSPVEFVPVAERTGLIFPLGNWIVRAAIDTLASWADRQRGDDPPPGLAINLSARQLSDPTLETTITERLSATGLDPRMIELEITETVLLDGNSAVVEVLGRLRDLGVRIAVDDFGTGYSSLDYLRTLPVDVVKIDRSFVSDIGSDPARRAIVQAVTDLGHALGLTIVAEGIEREDEARMVRALGCDLGQGFLFSRPVPAADALEMVQAGQVWRVPGPLEAAVV